MTAPYAVHDPQAKLDYGFDWEDWLAEGQTIAQSDWSAPTGITLSQPGVTGTVTRIRVAVDDANLAGQTVSIVNHVVSSDGQEDDRTLRLRIGDR